MNTPLPTSAALEKLVEAFPNNYCVLTLTDQYSPVAGCDPIFRASIVKGNDVFAHECDDPIKAAELAIHKARTEDPNARKIAELEAAGYTVTKNEAATL